MTLSGDLILGAGTTLRSTSRIAEDLGMSGLSADGVEGLCKALGVPCLIIGETKFVNVYYLQIALTAATRIGMPDFRVGGQEPSRLDPDALAENLPRVTAELISFRASDMKDMHDHIREAARGLFNRTKARTMTALLERAAEEDLKERSDRIFKSHGEWIVETEERIKYATLA